MVPFTLGITDLGYFIKAERIKEILDIIPQFYAEKINLYYLYIFNPYSSVENFCNVFYLKLVNLVLIHFCI